MERRRFSAGFKASIALEVIEHSRAIADIARENNVSEQSVSRWVRQYKAEHPEIGDKLTESEMDELRRLRRRVKSLEQAGGRVPGKSYSLLREETATVDVYAAISAEEGNYSVTMMCNAVSVSRSGYYAWKNHVPCARDLERRRLENLIVAIFDDSDHTYGYRRVHAQLARQGERIDDDTVRQIMGDLDLVACQPRPFRPVTTIAGDIAGLPDLVDRDFTATAPGAKLVGDITYIRTWEGWLYLATVLDCFSKKVIGYAMDSTMTSALTCDALSQGPGIVAFHEVRTSGRA